MDTKETVMAAQVAVLHRIAVALETLAMANAPAPNFAKPIETYKNFDFETIGATVKATDGSGAIALEWGGYTWTRRSPQNKFSEAIWFSRPLGKAEDGSVKYARLITFRKFNEAEPLPRKTEAAANTKPAPAKPTTCSTPAPTMPAAAPAASALDAHFGPNLRQVPAPAPTPTADPGAARKEFYAIAGEAIRTGKLTAQAVNEMVRTANGGGFAAALEMIREETK